MKKISICFQDLKQSSHQAPEGLVYLCLSWRVGEVSYFSILHHSLTSHAVCIYAPFKHLTMAVSHGCHQRIPSLLWESNASDKVNDGYRSLAVSLSSRDPWH